MSMRRGFSLPAHNRVYHFFPLPNHSTFSFHLSLPSPSLLLPDPPSFGSSLPGQSPTPMSVASADICSSAIGSFLFGYDSGIIGSVISKNYLQFQAYFSKTPVGSGGVVSDGILGAIVSVFAGGAFCKSPSPSHKGFGTNDCPLLVGALMAGQTADRIGRKRTIQIGALICIVGCVIQTAAVNSGMLIAGRFIAGWSIGVLSMIVPMYQAEISPPHARGLLSGWTQMMISLGFLVANWCVSSALGWRMASLTLRLGSVTVVNSFTVLVNSEFP